MDLAKHDMNALGNQGAWISIVGPDGRPTDLRIKIRGAQSDPLRKVQEDHKQRVAAAIKAAKGDKVDFEALDKVRDREMAIASTIDWENFEENGQPLACTPEAVARYYLHPGYDWLVVQVYAGAQDAKVFLTP
ncbi:hypothetical protein [Caldimonas sp. KR1-144]|uniref:hypothetical protein n=1 Tax=Caldimonas sp. KR1-144 TaxID=3400911 RepID=UPI003C115D26